MPAFPVFTPECEILLARHNAYWVERQARWRAYADAPWWERDLIVSPELRARYESWLPIREFLHSLAAIGGRWLPSPECLPYPLCREAYLSLPDFWAAMPAFLEKRVTFSQDEMLPLFCALADPPQFGVVCGRYPHQLECIRAMAHPGMRIVDVACGVGLNTLEIAAASGADTLGITSEWLEVWMARRRQLPHDPSRESAMRRFPQELNLHFQVGQAEQFILPAPVDLVVCNGLVGGRFFNQPGQFDGFLRSCQAALVPQGMVLLANHFHEGRRIWVEAFVRRARQAGFVVQGHWQELCLQKA